MPLARRLHIETEQKLLAARKAERCGFEGSRARMFEHTGDTEAAKSAALGGCAPAGFEIIVIGKRQRRIKQRLEFAAVDRGAHCGLVGQGGRLDEVAPAQLYRVD